MPQYVIDTLKPKNNNNFPVAEAVDVLYEKGSTVKDKIIAINALIVAAQQLIEDIQTDISELQTDVSELQSGKVDKVSGKGLSTNDFTNTYKSKVDNTYTKTETDTALAGKVDKVSGKGLSTNDFTNTYKNKVDNTYTKTETDSAIVNKIAEVVAEAPESFDTLKEIADWIDTHADSASAMNSAIQANTANIEKKVDKVEGKVLSTNDFTNEYKAKLDSVAEGANKYSLPTATASTLGGVKVDTSLSSSSTNPVQNKAVQNAIAANTADINKNTASITAMTKNIAAKQDAIDVKATGTLITLDNLQGGVPFSEIAISGENLAEKETTLYVRGKNLLPITSEHVTPYDSSKVRGSIADDGKLTFTTDGLESDKQNVSGIYKNTTYYIPIKQGEKYRVSFHVYSGIYSWNKIYLQVVWRSSLDSAFNKVTYLNLDYNGEGVYDFGEIKLTEELIELGADRFQINPWFWTSYTITDWNIALQVEVGDVATEYEPYHGQQITVTAPENSFVLSDNVNQYEGKNTIMISSGTAKVVGVSKSKALENIWNNVTTDTVTPQMYGAVGDGVHDDTAAIKAALASGRKHLRFPPGTYLTSTSIVIPEGTLVDGNKAIIRPTNEDASCFICEYSNTTIRNLEITMGVPYGRNDMATSAILIMSGENRPTENFRVENCYIHHMNKFAINISSRKSDDGYTVSAKCSNVFVENCVMDNVWIGVKQSHPFHTYINNCHISDTQAEAITCDDGTDTCYISNCSLVDNHGGVGLIGADDAKKVFISNCYINSTSTVNDVTNGITFNRHTGKCEHVQITNCIFSTVTRGVWCRKSDDEYEYDGIDNLTVTGCEFVGYGQAFCLEHLGSRNVIMNNKFTSSNLGTILYIEPANFTNIITGLKTDIVIPIEPTIIKEGAAFSDIAMINNCYIKNGIVYFSVGLTTTTDRVDHEELFSLPVKPISQHFFTGLATIKAVPFAAYIPSATGVCIGGAAWAGEADTDNYLITGNYAYLLW